MITTKGFKYRNHKLYQLSFPLAYFNSIKVAVISTVVAITSATLAGYAFAKLKFKGSNVLFIIYLAQMMVPSQLTLIPRFVIFSQLGWMNTHMSLIVPKIIAVSSTFMLRQSFLGTPDELREAARIDGAGEYRAFAQVMLPLVKPAIAATATVQFLDAWNSYLDPLVFISNWKKWTIPLALNQFVGSEVTQYNLTMAACCLAVVPVFIVFLCGQRFFLKRIICRCRQRLINQTRNVCRQEGEFSSPACFAIGAAKLGRGEYYVST